MPMFHEAIEEITVVCFYGPKHIGGNTVFQ